MNPNICFGFSAQDWQSLSTKLQDGDEDAWTTAVGVFERRMTERFFSCIDALEYADTKPDLDVADPIGADKTANHQRVAEEGPRRCIPGFAIIALCCLLIESLQEFREEPENAQNPEGPCTFPHGQCIKPGSGTNRRFRAFLRHAAFKGAFGGNLASKFCEGIRNGIVHQAETRRWVIWRDEPVGTIVSPDEDGYALNRTLFYQAVREIFQEYIRDLRDPQNRELRARFKEQMNRLCERS